MVSRFINFKSLSLSLSPHGTQCLKKIVSYLINQDIRAFWSWIWCHWTLSLLPCSIIGWKNESLGWYSMNLKLNHPSSIKIIIIIIFCHWSILFFTITIFSFLFIELIVFELVDLCLSYILWSQMLIAFGKMNVMLHINVIGHCLILDSKFRILRARLVAYFEQPFEYFKYTYTYFHAHFHQHVYQKHSNNITQTPLSNTP